MIKRLAAILLVIFWSSAFLGCGDDRWGLSRTKMLPSPVVVQVPTKPPVCKKDSDDKECRH